MANGKRILVFTLAAMALVTGASAQGFFGKLKNKAEKKLKQNTERVVRGTVNGVVNDVVRGAKGTAKDKKSSVKNKSAQTENEGRQPEENDASAENRNGSGAKNTAKSANAIVSSLSQDRSRVKVKAGKRRRTIRLCDELGTSIDPRLGTVSTMTEMPSNIGELEVQRKWFPAQESCENFTNARLVEEVKRIGGWLGSDEARGRQNEASYTLDHRVKEIEGTIINMKEMLDQRQDEDDASGELEEHFMEQMLNNMKGRSYKQAMRSSLEPLYPYMRDSVVEFLKATDLKTFTVEVVM